MTRFEATDEFRAAEFVHCDMSGAMFRAADLTGARTYGVLLSGADIDGDITDAGSYGIDLTVEPTFDRVVEVRAERMAQVAAFLAEVTQEELDRVREPAPGPGFPPPAPRTVTQCLHVLLSEEWEHHRFAVRDLDAVVP